MGRDPPGPRRPILSPPTQQVFSEHLLRVRHWDPGPGTPWGPGGTAAQTTPLGEPQNPSPEGPWPRRGRQAPWTLLADPAPADRPARARPGSAGQQSSKARITGSACTRTPGSPAPPQAVPMEHEAAVSFLGDARAAPQGSMKTQRCLGGRRPGGAGTGRHNQGLINILIAAGSPGAAAGHRRSIRSGRRLSRGEEPRKGAKQTYFNNAKNNRVDIPFCLGSPGSFLTRLLGARPVLRAGHGPRAPASQTELSGLLVGSGGTCAPAGPPQARPAVGVAPPLPPPRESQAWVNVSFNRWTR